MPSSVVDRARELASLADRRAALATHDVGARDRSRQLREHLLSYVLPRAQSLDAPLLVAILGPTGAGKSSLLNALARERVSAAGVLRPTTRHAIVLASTGDAAALFAGPLSRIPRDRVAIVVSRMDGVAIVDAPDIDSIEHANRAIADALLEAADLCVFVTTAVRYADQVQWDVLARARGRRLPLVVVVNRLPPDARERADVLEDVERLVRGGGLTALSGGDVEIVPVDEGAIDPATSGLDERAIALVRARVERLAADRDERRRVAERALAGALLGLAPLVASVADDLDRERANVAALREQVAAAYRDELTALLAEVREGRTLRDEVLRQWHAFVNADQITRLFTRGLLRIEREIMALVRGTPPAPSAAVERGATSDVVALALSHATEAARRSAHAWSGSADVADALALDPTLWSASADFSRELEAQLHAWVDGIRADVQARGAAKRRFAFGASLGVNALGVAVMLGVFAHTAGITGTEIGIAAGTGFLNQKLLEALFGEAAMTEMIRNARADLERVLAERFAAERARFERLVAEPDALASLASELRPYATPEAA